MRSIAPFLFSVLTLLGCGGSSTSDGGPSPASQATIDNTCSADCAARKRCLSTVDETTCVNKCKNEGASFVGKVRSDYVQLIADCDATASCDKLNDCDDQAKASISPTSFAQTFCDDYVKKTAECKVTADKSKCLESYKMFTDETLAAAQTCNTKACTDFLGCVLTTVGLK